MAENILQWNCNGLLYHAAELKQLILEHDPFCVCMQETHLKPEATFIMRGYSATRKDDILVNRAKGGVIILLKDNIPYTHIPLQTNLQAVAIQIQFPTKMSICNIYLPDCHWNVKDLEAIVSQLQSPFLLIGDFNSHNTIWGSNSTNAKGKILERFIDKLNLVLLNNGKGTFLNSRSNCLSAIDLSLSSPTLAPLLSWNVLDNLLYSDHFAISIEYTPRNHTNSYLPKWRYDKANWVNFSKSLESISVGRHIDKSVETLTTKIYRAAEESIPMSSGRTGKKTVPWWNEEVKLAIENKKKALKLFQRYPTRDNMIDFKRYRALARRTILYNKKHSWQRYVQKITSETPIGDVWKKVKKIVGRTSPSMATNILVKGKSLSDVAEITEAIAEYYEEVSSSNNYDPSFQQAKHALEIPLDFSSRLKLSYNNPFTQKDFENALASVGNTSPGPDKISYEIIRQLPKQAKLELLKLYNQIWHTSTYPRKWREADIIPLLKPGKDPTLTSSYRPISLTNCMGKLLEKMVSTRLVWCLERYNHLSPCQMGFRKNRSTIDNMVILENAIQNNFALRQHLVAVFFDIEKAYDMTWRYGILQTLHKWGYRGNLPLFIQSFLSDRKFRVRIGSITSTKYKLENGIPQGSTLSVNLFIIAVNNLIRSIDGEISRTLYVDDLCIFISARSISEIELKLQSEIDEIVDRGDRLGFRFSASKTRCVHFCRLRKPHNDPHLLLKGSQILNVDAIKFLGLTFDRKLRWKQHVSDLAVRCQKGINLIRCLSNIDWGAEREVLLNLYRSLVLAKIEYGCIVYSSARKSLLKKLESIHCVGLRLAIGAFPTSPLTAICCESGYPPLEIRINQFLLNYGAKIWTQPNHPNHSLLFNSPSYRIYQNRPTITRPVAVRLKEEAGICISNNAVYNLGVGEIPPWELKIPHIHTECSKFQKGQINNAVFISSFIEIISRYPGFQEIYTDGSKTEHGTASAFYTSGEAHSWTLPTTASIYTAELYAIWQSLLYIDHSLKINFLICSDSSSAIQALTETFATDPMIQQIMALIHILICKGKKVILVWTPAHVGIRGNEEADREANQATHNHTPEIIPVRLEDIKSKNKKYNKEIWQQKWNNTMTKLKIIKPTVDVWKLPRTLTRREQVAITRLRIGHTQITSKYLFQGEEQPRCSNCNTVLTVQHILQDCVSYNNLRNELQIPDHISLTLNNQLDIINKVIQFLYRTELMRKI